MIIIIQFCVLVLLSNNVNCEVNAGDQQKLLNGFIDGINNIRNKAFNYDYEQILDAQNEVTSGDQMEVQPNRFERSTLPGGEVERDTHDKKYWALAEKSLKKFVTTSGVKENYEVKNIVRVTEQLVAGVITRITFMIAPRGVSTHFKCFSSIFEQAWKNVSEITVDCDLGSQKRTKRKVLGGQEDKDTHDKKYWALAEKSLKKFVRTSGVKENYEVKSIERVTEQVVAGLITRINFMIAPKGVSTHFKCFSSIFEQAWKNVSEITVDCDLDSQKRTKSKFIGGEVEKDPHDKKYWALAEKSLKKFVTTHRVKENFEVTNIVRVTEQLVEGLITKITFMIARKGVSTRDKCFSSIYEIAWKNFSKITVDCHFLLLKNTKRQFFGGEVEKDPHDKKYWALAEKSLKKFVTTHRVKENFEVTNIVRVTEQLVEGLITKITFMIARKGVSTRDKCFSSIYEIAWKKFSKITVDCDFLLLKNTKRRFFGGEVEKNRHDRKYSIMPLEKSL